MATPTSAENGKVKKPGRFLLLASLGFFLIFAASIVIGKITVSQGATKATGLGDVGEFLTLFVSVVFFIAACLARERAAKEKDKASI